MEGSKREEPGKNDKEKNQRTSHSVTGVSILGACAHPVVLGPKRSRGIPKHACHENVFVQCIITTTCLVLQLVCWRLLRRCHGPQIRFHHAWPMNCSMHENCSGFRKDALNSMLSNAILVVGPNTTELDVL